ncbi:MAG: hypothetical protein V3V35_08480 [Dehalococcoidia bacterium]
MGKLIEKLDRVGKSGGHRLGFTPSSAADTPGLAIVVAVAAADSDTAQAAVAQGADAVLLIGSSPKASKRSPEKRLKLEKSAPCGGDAAALAANESGPWDFAVVDLADPLEPMVEKPDVDVVLRLPSDAPEATLRTLEALPVDAVAVAGPGGALTLDGLVPLCRVAQATSMPVLALVAPEIGRASLLALRDAGAAGVIVDIAAGRADAVTSLRKTILDLPPKKAKRVRARPTVPLGLLTTDDAAYEDEEEDRHGQAPPEAGQLTGGGGIDDGNGDR